MKNEVPGIFLQRYLLYQKKNIPAIFFISQVKNLKHGKIGKDYVGTTFLPSIVKLGPKLLLV